ncbi:peptide ABC transporter substrate-binding protein [Candidatus Uhrbacteria bacterium]|nr:peptide ABC transporter substrate-binding protein [Candidatus Uhrbacteria bacterium]
MNAILARLRALVRRIFFWLPSAAPSDEVRPDIVHDHDLLLSVTETHRIPRIRQLRYISRILSTPERRTAVIALFVFLVTSLGGFGYLAYTRMVRVPVVGGTLTEALVGEPTYINPVDAPANDVDRDISSLIFSGLFRMNGLEAEPDLAERYAWSEDGKTLTATLRQDARFHDGEEVTADDVVFTIDSIQNPARTSPLAARFRGIKAVATDAKTVQFILDRPDATFLTALTVGILPQHKWQDIPPANARLADLNLKPIGSGPYRFKSFTRDSKGFIRSYTLERFARYAGIKPFLQTIVFQFYTDRKLAEDALKADLVNALAFSPLAQQQNESSRWQTVELELPQQTIAFLNLKKKVLQDEKIRRALAGAVDRDELVTAWRGHAAPASGPFPFEQASSTSIGLDDARALLDAAGWRLPADGNVRISFRGPTSSTPTVTASSTELALTIITSDQRELVAVAEALKRRWSLLGVKVAVESLLPEEFLRRATRDRGADVALTTVLLSPEQDLFPFWWSGQRTDRGLNLSSLADRDVDAALEASRAASSTAQLSELRGTLSKLILRSTPAIFLVRPTSPYLISKKVRGVRNRASVSQPSDRFNDLVRWYIKTGWRWR